MRPGRLPHLSEDRLPRVRGSEPPSPNHGEPYLADDLGLFPPRSQDAAMTGENMPEHEAGERGHDARPARR